MSHLPSSHLPVDDIILKPEIDIYILKPKSLYETPRSKERKSFHIFVTEKRTTISSSVN